MKRLIDFLLGFSGEVGGVTHLTLLAGTTPMAVPGEVTYYTRAVNVSKGYAFGIKFKALSATGTPTLKLEIEESDVLPTTEGSADTNFVVPDSASDLISNLNDEVWHVRVFPLVPMTYARLKITGLSGNPADTTLEARAFIQSIM